MSRTEAADHNDGITGHSKRVVFTMGGKGGVGKTGCMLALAEWFEANQLPFTLLDLDTENKARGSLKHYFNGAARKVNGCVKYGPSAHRIG